MFLLSCSYSIAILSYRKRIVWFFESSWYFSFFLLPVPFLFFGKLFWFSDFQFWKPLLLFLLLLRVLLLLLLFPPSPPFFFVGLQFTLRFPLFGSNQISVHSSPSAGAFSFLIQFLFMLMGRRSWMMQKERLGAVQISVFLPLSLSWEANFIHEQLPMAGSKLFLSLDYRCKQSCSLSLSFQTNTKTNVK